MKKLVLFFSIAIKLMAMPTGTYGVCKGVTPDATRLKIVETEIVVNGKSSKIFKIVESDGSEIIYKTEGKCFNLVVENHTSVPTSLHWHGLILPVLEDGVSYVTQPPIPPGKSYPYNFTVEQAGTFWTHTHFGLQEQKLMSAPLILLPEEGEKYRSIVLFFEGFTFKSIEEVWLGLRKNLMEARKAKGKDWLPPFMVAQKMDGDQDLNDVDFDAFLTNGKTLESPDIYLVKPREKVCLRLINGSVSSGFHISLGDLKGEIIAVDGSPVVPIAYNDFPIATAQRVDVLVTIPKKGGVFPILAQCQGTNMRTGAILKTKGETVSPITSHSNQKAGAITNEIEKKLRAKDPLEKRKVDRTLKATLNGNMKYYVWGINEHVWPNDAPLYVKEGERVELEFINESEMSHPMHLHGHVFQVVEIDGESFPGAMRDTILVMPAQKVKVAFDANNPGIWAMHCHISYHLWAGMFTVVLYEGFTPPYFSKQTITNYSHTYGGY